jgi:hypothetical protein
VQPTIESTQRASGCDLSTLPDKHQSSGYAPRLSYLPDHLQHSASIRSRSQSAAFVFLSEQAASGCTSSLWKSKCPLSSWKDLVIEVSAGAVDRAVARELCRNLRRCSNPVHVNANKAPTRTTRWHSCVISPCPCLPCTTCHIRHPTSAQRPEARGCCKSVLGCGVRGGSGSA